MFIYLIVNQATGKYYVGQHKGNNLRKYLQTKISDANRNRGGNSYLYASMRKHPKEAWSIHALLSDVQTRAELDQHEKDFISFLRSQDPEYGYNIQRGGEGFTGPHSEETKRKCSEAGKIGGRMGGLIGGRMAVENGHLARAGRIGAQRQHELYPELAINVFRLVGRKAVESGQLAKARTPESSATGLCKRWNINRGKPCTCGEHGEKGATA
jgi:hypothetical protein